MKGDGPRDGRVMLSILAVAIASAGGFWLGTLRHLSNGNLGLVARENSLDFGEVWEQHDFSWTIAIDNPTSETVVIESLEASCGCTAPEPNSLTIAPASSADIRLRIDLSPRDASAATLALSDFVVGVTPHFRQRDRKLPGKGWTVRGRVRRAIRPSERSVSFAMPLVSGGPPETLTLVAAPLRPLSLVEVSAVPPLVSCAVTRTAGQDEFHIDVTSNQELPVGPFKCFLLLRGVTDEGECLPPVGVKVDGLVRAPVVAIPEAVNLGLRSPGEVAETTVRLEPLLNCEYQIERTDVRGQDAEHVTVEKDSPRAMRIRMPINRPGQPLC